MPLYDAEQGAVAAGWTATTHQASEVRDGRKTLVVAPLSSIVVLLSGTATDAAAANGQDWGPWGMHMMWGSWGMA